MVVANLDYNATTKDTVALKYYYQHDPTLAPYAYSSVPGFTEHLDSGAQVFSIINTYLIKPNLSTTQTLGFLREKTYADNEQPFGPGAIPGGSLGNVTINEFGSNYFPGVSIVNVLGDGGEHRPVGEHRHPEHRPQRGRPGLQHRRLPEPPAALGQCNLDAGQAHGQLRRQLQLHAAQHHRQAHRQRHRRHRRPERLRAGLRHAGQLLHRASMSARSCRATPAATIAPTRSAVTCRTSSRSRRRSRSPPACAMTGTVDSLRSRDASSTSTPALYSYNAASDTITNPGFIIAGNNANGTSGVSPTTLTGRQWGIRAAAWRRMAANNVREQGGRPRGHRHVLRPRRALQLLLARLRHRHCHRRPFGVNQQLPFVTASTCPVATLYSYYIPTCGGLANGGDPFAPPTIAPTPTTGNLANPVQQR